MKLQLATLSQPGTRPYNEDACGYWSHGGRCFIVLSDGAGGHGGGEVAAKLAVTQALSYFQIDPACTQAAVQSALDAANRAIVKTQRRDARYQAMRATAVILAVDTQRNQAIWGHLGDSRLYWLRNGKILTQTRDHSVAQSMVDAGYVALDQLRTMPDRSKLLAALGSEDDFDPNVEAHAHTLQSGDAFLLCTDGVWEHVLEAEMEQTFGASTDAQDWVKRLESTLIEKRIAKQDNYSMVAVACC